MVKENYSWERFKRFFKRNDIFFACTALLVVTHFAWWQVQQNKAFVDVKDRKRSIGPFTIPYLDETEYFKKLSKNKSSKSDE